MTSTQTTLLAALALVAAPALLAQEGQETETRGGAGDPAETPAQGQGEPEPAQQDDPPAPPPSRGGADPSDDAFEFGSPPALPDGMTEEMMWPAATAEQWKEPVLVQWQRSVADAMEVAKRTNRPVMVAVNMDGEIASEHFAGIRYRDPATAEVMSQYVCVIASVYRHTPRDYEPDGTRVECPRFGTVTCGEHIQAERELYGQYFDGRRISPRHIVLETDGSETYDVFYSWDVQSVTKMFRVALEDRPEPIPSPEPTLENLVRSPDVADRIVLERMYESGDREAKRRILLALMEEPALDQVEVLRKGIFGLDLELARTARRALAKCETEGALDLMAEALKVPLPEEERRVLLDAVERLAATSTRAKTLANLHSGLGTGSKAIDPERIAAEYEASAEKSRARSGRATEWSEDPTELVDLAESLIVRADAEREPYRGFMVRDARKALDEATAAGAGGARVTAIDAAILYAEGMRGDATERAVEAIDAGLVAFAGAEGEALPAPDVAPEVSATALRLFGESRRAKIRAAYRAGEEWEAEWLSDVNAAYSALEERPDAAADVFIEHQDFLRWIGASPRANRVLDRALERFPADARLHERLRRRLLWEGGPAMLERAYDLRLADPGLPENDPDQLHWYAGYASLVAAEQHRRRSCFDEAIGSYGRSVERFQRNAELNPDGADNAQHYITLVRAGRARVRMEEGDLAGATEDLLASLTLRPASAGSQDGMGITPLATAKMLEEKLKVAGETERAAQVRAAMDALPAEVLEPPPSERMGSGR